MASPFIRLIDIFLKVKAGLALGGGSRALSVLKSFGNGAKTQLQQQLSDNQSDIDSLRGQIQENQYQLNQVMERQKQIMLQL
ncbi:hypothetical protein MJL48_34320, partial [Salmonella enterica subsp. enterica serovar Kentucky]|nr:hypothetical protein [Salmonella enterica subsp. enterica serovar Kentucky]